MLIEYKRIVPFFRKYEWTASKTHANAFYNISRCKVHDFAHDFARLLRSLRARYRESVAAQRTKIYATRCPRKQFVTARLIYKCSRVRARAESQRRPEIDNDASATYRAIRRARSLRTVPPDARNAIHLLIESHCQCHLPRADTVVQFLNERGEVAVHG